MFGVSEMRLEEQRAPNPISEGTCVLTKEFALYQERLGKLLKDLNQEIDMTTYVI